MQPIKKIAVLGAGSGGFMCCADMGSMESRGRPVLPRHEARIQGVKDHGAIEVLDIDSKPTGMAGKVALATSDIAAAVKGAQVILNPIPYFASEEYARLTLPHLEEGQVVVQLGKGGASLTWAKVARELKIRKKIYFADTNTLPYGASRKGERQVELENRTLNLILATFPGKDIDEVAELVSQVFTKETATRSGRGRTPSTRSSSSYNAITHTPPMICNAARIESGEKRFFLFGKKENAQGVVRMIGRARTGERWRSDRPSA